MMEVQKWQPHLHCCAMEMPVAPTPTTQVPCNLYMLLFGKLFLLLPTNPPELPSPGYPWSWIHKHLQEIDSGTVTKSQSVHCVIDNNLHSILHTHCVTKAQWKLWKLHLVVLCKDFASHSAHTFVLPQPKYESYIWLCCTQTLHFVVHIHLCLQSTTRMSKLHLGCVVHRLCIPFCTHICI